MNTPQQAAARRKRTQQPKLQLQGAQYDNNSYRILVQEGRVIENWHPDYRAEMLRLAQEAGMTLCEFLMECNRRWFANLFSPTLQTAMTVN